MEITLFRKLLVGIIFIFILMQVFFIRYNMRTNLWLTGTNKIIIQEYVIRYQINRVNSIVIEDPKLITAFKEYLEKTRVRYNFGEYWKDYKIILTNGNQKKEYGYVCGNYLVDFGKCPGSLSWILRSYELQSSSFNSFIGSILKKHRFDKRSLKLSLINRKQEGAK